MDVKGKNSKKAVIQHNVLKNDNFVDIYTSLWSTNTSFCNYISAFYSVVNEDCSTLSLCLDDLDMFVRAYPPISVLFSMTCQILNERYKNKNFSYDSTGIWPTELSLVMRSLHSYFAGYDSEDSGFCDLLIYDYSMGHFEWEFSQTNDYDIIKYLEACEEGDFIYCQGYRVPLANYDVEPLGYMISYYDYHFGFIISEGSIYKTVTLSNHENYLVYTNYKCDGQYNFMSYEDICLLELSLNVRMKEKTFMLLLSMDLDLLVSYDEFELTVFYKDNLSSSITFENIVDHPSGHFYNLLKNMVKSKQIGVVWDHSFDNDWVD